MSAATSPPTAYGQHPVPQLVGWTVHVSSVPVAITVTNPTWPTSDVDLLYNLSRSFGFGFRQIDDIWRSSHEGSVVAGYVIELRSGAQSSPDAVPLRVEQIRIVPGTNDRRIAHAVIEVACEALAIEADRDVGSAHSSMAKAVSDVLREAGMPAEAVAMITEAWTAAPPTLAVQVLTAPTVRNDLAAPAQLDAALVSETDRHVARAVREAGIQPGTYRGDDAKGLDRDVLAPAALEVLTQRMAAYQMDDLVLFGMEQLERITAHRDKDLRDIRQSARLLSLDWDPAVRYREVQDKYLTLRRCAETAIEAALRKGPSGGSPVDAVAWSEVLAAANAYLAATTRSESIHHQVTPAALRISDSFEIEIIPDDDATVGGDRGRVYDLDIQAFREARAALDLAEDAAPTTAESQDGDVVVGLGLADPDVDTQMHGAYGVSATDIFTALFALAAWPLGPDDDDVATAAPRQIIDYLLETTVLGDDTDGPSRAAAAVSMLSSTAAELHEEDWKPWHARTRKRRLLIQPLPTLSDDSLVIAPHICLGSLGVYHNYLSQGQLPWSQPSPPKKVETALERTRDRRNKALEKHVAKILRDKGWSVVENVAKNKPQRLNLPSLSTEIDAVAGRADLRVLWLLEVKDPVDTYVVPEIRRHLDSFFVDHKKPSYVTQFRRKIADLAPHADAVARALGLPPRMPADPYVVKALFVTRKPVPAAFVTSDVQFVSIAGMLPRLAGG